MERNLSIRLGFEVLGVAQVATWPLTLVLDATVMQLLGSDLLTSGRYPSLISSFVDSA